jgi:kynureninase
MAVLPAVIYTSGQLLDVAAITCEARRREVLIGWDLSHAIGAVPIDLDSCDADFAFWCNYKYLNAGPGATGGLYLNRRHFDRLPGLAGWFGSDKSKQFDMSFESTFAADADRLHNGTPHILSLAPLEGSLKVLYAAGLARLREKSLKLTRYLMELADVRLARLGFALGTPREDERRGGHVALLHPEAARICRALRARGVVPDFRPPNIVRLAPVPLYTRFVDCVDAVEIIEQVFVGREYEQFDRGREVVS